MVLLIDGQTYSQKCTLQDLARHTDLTRSSTDFAQTSECKQPSEEVPRTIYVHQREFAVVAKNDPNGFNLIGSDDATTCHILALDNQNAVGVIHLDGGETQESLDKLLQEMKQYAPDNTNYDAYLVGGFLDHSSQQHSQTLSDEVLTLFSIMPNVSFNLKLAAITAYNDHVVDNIHYPLIYGICFDVQTKAIRKMNFVDFGPAFRLRTVYLSVDQHSAWCLYSSLKGTITIEQFSVNGNIIRRYYEPLYHFSFHIDQELLSSTSTSPKQERPSYLNQTRKTILYLLRYWKELPEWFDPQTHSIVYYRSNGTWVTDNTKIVDDVENE